MSYCSGVVFMMVKSCCRLKIVFGNPVQYTYALKTARRETIEFQ